MDGMQSMWWEVENENGTHPTSGSRLSFSLNFGGISAIAEIAAVSFWPLLNAPDFHSLACGFTHCTWVDELGNAHEESLLDSSDNAGVWPVSLARNGINRLAGEIDVTAGAGRVLLNVFIWPHVY